MLLNLVIKPLPHEDASLLQTYDAALGRYVLRSGLPRKGCSCCYYAVTADDLAIDLTQKELI